MTTTTLRRAAGAALAIACLVPVVAGCSSSSGDSTTAKFCQLNKDLDVMDMGDVDMNDPAAAIKSFTSINDKIKGVEAPAEIKDDWTTVQHFFGTLSDSLKDVDPSDSTAFASALTDPSLQADASKMSDIGTHLETFVKDNC